MTKRNIIVGAVAVVGVATAWLLEHRAQTKLREQNEVLQQKVEQLAQLSAESQPLSRGVAQTTRNSSSPDELFRELLRLRGEYGVLRKEKDEFGQLLADNRRLLSNWVEQLFSGKKLDLLQVAPYLEAKQRSAESLLAASRLTGDQALLREAIEKYPSDPRVNYAAYFAFKNELSPLERRQWLDAFKQSAPDNALANYLLAQDYFKAGQPERAVQEFVAASGKPKFQDYSGDFVQSAEDAYRAAGLSTVEAKKLAVFGLPLPQLAELRNLGQSLSDLANRYRQAGDEASAQAALQLGVALGRQVSESSEQNSFVQNLVGIAIQSKILAAVDPASPYGNAGQTVKGRLDELARQRETIKEFGKDSYELLQALPEQDQISFFDRMKVSGELEALRWARTRPAKP